ncbi:zinc-ribbon domain-containing protein [Haloparvum sp. PAK95]
MGLLSTLRRAVEGESSTLWECRNCGETLSENAEECPSCGTEDAVCYEL